MRSALAKPARTTSERPAPSQAMASMKPSEASSQKRLGKRRNAARRDPRCASRPWRKGGTGVRPSWPSSGSSCWARQRKATKYTKPRRRRRTKRVSQYGERATGGLGFYRRARAPINPPSRGCGVARHALCASRGEVAGNEAGGRRGGARAGGGGLSRQAGADLRVRAAAHDHLHRRARPAGRTDQHDAAAPRAGVAPGRGAVARAGRAPSPIFFERIPRRRGHRRPADALPYGVRMKSIGILAVAALLATPALADDVCQLPRCLDVVVPVPAGLVVPDSTVRVLLPTDYDGHRRYPVLYLLHGAGDTFATWSERTDVQDFSAQFPLIIVMPDGGHDANAGFYSDWADGSRQWETFHTSVLKKYIDRHFRTMSSWKHRAAAGLSMGGFGAMSYAA